MKRSRVLFDYICKLAVEKLELKEENGRLRNQINELIDALFELSMEKIEEK